jgi:hypothetical protein
MKYKTIISSAIYRFLKYQGFDDGESFDIGYFLFLPLLEPPQAGPNA